MPTFTNPQGVAKPSSSYVHSVLVTSPAKRLIISGQVGVGLDGTVADGISAQARQAFDNLLAIVKAADMDVTDIVKIVTYCTRREDLAAMREVRKEKFGAHTPTSTLLIVAGLANPEFLIEVEAEAVQELR